MDNYIVICRVDVDFDGTPGAYVLATRKVFTSRASAQAYAQTVNASREPLVVAGRFAELRFE